MHITHGMQELSRLSFQRSANRLRPMAESGHGERRRKVQETIAIYIPDVHSVARSQKTGKSSASQVTSLASKRESFSAKARDRGPGIVVTISGSMQFSRLR